MYSLNAYDQLPDNLTDQDKIAVKVLSEQQYPGSSQGIGV